ncbi:hypothetical protein B0T13DRAFT_451206 [Neurospora crassa]|nr:hypothetical protein B0T13DRAFT_451206 [Neurospora crassa]
MPYAHDLLFSGGLCFAVPLSGMEATLGSHLIAVQHAHDPFPSEDRAGGSRVVLKRYRVGKQRVESVSLCLGTVQEQAGTSARKGKRGSRKANNVIVRKVLTNKPDSHTYNQQRVYQGVPCPLQCWFITVAVKLHGATFVEKTSIRVITEAAALEAGTEAGVEVENGRKPSIEKRQRGCFNNGDTCARVKNVD